MGLKNKNIFYISLIVIVIFSTLYFNIGTNLEINVNMCELGDKKINYENIDSKLYIVGHAYGKPGEGDFFPENLTDYLKADSEPHLKNNYIALTGDFVRIASIENLQKVKEYLGNNFKDFFISPGNHEVDEFQNYLNIFKFDFYSKEFNNYLLISANFSTNNWLPSDEQKEKINELINESKKEVIVLLSHQIFWLKEFPDDLNPNSYDLLKYELSPNSLYWIENLDNKKLVIISGDYGAWGDKTYCNYREDITFIANGIGNHPNDSLIEILEYRNNVLIQEKTLVNK